MKQFKNVHKQLTKKLEEAIECTVMSGRRSIGKGDFCFDGLRYLARGAVMSSAYGATDLVGRWP